MKLKFLLALSLLTSQQVFAGAISLEQFAIHCQQIAEKFHTEADHRPMPFQFTNYLGQAQTSKSLMKVNALGACISNLDEASVQVQRINDPKINITVQLKHSSNGQVVLKGSPTTKCAIDTFEYTKQQYILQGFEMTPEFESALRENAAHQYCPAFEKAVVDALIAAFLNA